MNSSVGSTHVARRTLQVTLDDVDADTLRALLQYLYTDELDRVGE